MAKIYEFRGKGISIAQPWAAAIAFAGKEIENRSWRTHYRGPLAIHASGTLWAGGLEERVRAVRGGEKRPLSFWIGRGRRRWHPDKRDGGIDRGAIIAIAMLVDLSARSANSSAVDPMPSRCGSPRASSIAIRLRRMSPAKLAVRLAASPARSTVSPPARACRAASNASSICWRPGVMPTTTTRAAGLIQSNGA